MKTLLAINERNHLHLDLPSIFLFKRNLFLCVLYWFLYNPLLPETHTQFIIFSYKILLLHVLIIVIVVLCLLFCVYCASEWEQRKHLGASHVRVLFEIWYLCPYICYIIRHHKSPKWAQKEKWKSQENCTRDVSFF
jgi:hypothetical protein